MKHCKLLIAPVVALLAALPLLFSACSDSYDPPGSAYDPNLIGQWQLAQVDGVPVSGYQTNYLTFYRNGTGIYDYYYKGEPYYMDLYYAVEFYGNTATLYIDYSDGSSVNMNYWFNSNYTRLYMQWMDSSGLHTYCYYYVGRNAAPPKAEKLPEDKKAEADFTPGL